MHLRQIKFSTNLVLVVKECRIELSHRVFEPQDCGSCSSGWFYLILIGLWSSFLSEMNPLKTYLAVGVRFPSSHTSLRQELSVSHHMNSPWECKWQVFSKQMIWEKKRDLFTYERGCALQIEEEFYELILEGHISVEFYLLETSCQVQHFPKGMHD